jgi:hypothetical protein
MLSKLLNKIENNKTENILDSKDEKKNIPRSYSDSSFILKKTKQETSYNFHLEILPENIALIYYNKNYFNNVTFLLMKEVFFQNTFTFLSLTVCDNEISIFIDQSIAEKFVNTNDTDSNNFVPSSIDRDYRAIRVYDSIDGISHIGIVKKISTLMAEHNIPILYVNSYNNNYILISDNDLQNAKKCLTEYGFLF